MKRLTIVLVWLGTTFWFVRYEAFPEWFTRAARGYQDLLPSGTLIQDRWMRIVYRGRPAGYSRTRIETDETSTRERHRMLNETQLNLRLMGMTERIAVSVDAAVDVAYRLQMFSLQAHSHYNHTRITGRRAQGTQFRVDVETGGSRRSSLVTIPDDAVLYHPGMDLAVARMRPGEKRTFKSVEPLTLRPSIVTLEALPRETIRFGGADTNVAVIALDYLGARVRSWIGGDGVLLRQETLFKDLVAEACSPAEAMRAAASTAGTDDLIREMAIRVPIPLRNPEHYRLLRYRIRGLTAAANALRGPRQVVEEQSGGQTTLTVRSQRLPADGALPSPLPDTFKPWLASSAFIQADHPDIVKLARQITEKAAGPVARALAIQNWVFQHIDKKAAPGIPSAIEVLRTRAGDCNEHTYLTVALARAAGLPAKVIIGLVYSEALGGFAYHAWPSIYVGEWLETDPTLGQRTVDATHIGLIEGEFENQIGLAEMIGTLGLTVLEREGT